MAGEHTCSNCGAVSPADARFCDQCGTAFAEAATPTATLPAPPPPPATQTLPAPPPPTTQTLPAPPPPPGAAATSAAAPVPAQRRPLPRLLIPIVAGVVALLLAGGGVTAWWFTSNAQPTATSAEESADTPTDGAAKPIATATAQPTATPSSAPIVNHAFKSQSGNLRCSVGAFNGVPGAICQQVNINYAFPAQACTTGAPGVFVGVTDSGAYWPCVPSFAEPAEVIAYDAPVTVAGMTCSINYDTGVTCTNSRGQGFTMEYDAGVRTF